MRLIWTTVICAMTGSLAHADPAPAPAPTDARKPEQPPGYGPQLPPPAPSNPHAETGLLDAGVTVGALIASGVRDVFVAPAFGRFVADNLDIAAVGAVSYTRSGDRSATLWAGLIEPSYHLELNPTTFAVLGMAVGVAYQHTLGTGLEVAPRVGLSFALGRLSVISTGVTYQYLTHSAADGRDDPAVVALTSALRVYLGYSLRW
jgi:hypothetical protein